MPRKAAIIPNIHLHTTIPQHLWVKLQLHLYSEVEGKVPQGALQEFVCARLTEFFDKLQRSKQNDTRN